MKPGDDLDGLLRAFFRSQMPDPWPAPPVPRSASVVTMRPASSRHPLMRSRFALAASVALLLLGSLFLPGRFTHDLKPGSDAEGLMYGRDVERERMRQEMKSKHFEDQNKAGPGEGDGGPIHDSDEFDLPSMK